MKKLLLIYVLFVYSFLSYVQCNPDSNSNLISRGLLAGIIFEKLNEDSLNIYSYRVSHFSRLLVGLLTKDRTKDKTDAPLIVSMCNWSFFMPMF